MASIKENLFSTRNTFIADVERFLFDATNTKIENKLRDLISTNSSYYNNTSTKLSYNNKIYICPNLHYLNKDWPYLLHPEVRPQFRIWLKEKDKFEKDKTLALSYPRKVITFTNEPKNLEYLLPKKLHSLLSFTRYGEELYGEKTKQELDFFMSKNQHELNLLKGQLLKNFMFSR